MSSPAAWVQQRRRARARRRALQRHRTLERDGYRIETDPALMDVEAVHAFLTTAYWSQGCSLERVRRSIAGSARVYGLFRGGEQVGFARVVSDLSTQAYLGDVYVLAAHRGRGLGTWLVETAVDDPDLAGLKWLLRTQDAHSLYRRFGFTPATGETMERMPAEPL